MATALFSGQRWSGHGAPSSIGTQLKESSTGRVDDMSFTIMMQKWTNPYRAAPLGGRLPHRYPDSPCGRTRRRAGAAPPNEPANCPRCKTACADVTTWTYLNPAYARIEFVALAVYRLKLSPKLSTWQLLSPSTSPGHLRAPRGSSGMLIAEKWGLRNAHATCSVVSTG